MFSASKRQKQDDAAASVKVQEPGACAAAGEVQSVKEECPDSNDLPEAPCHLAVGQATADEEIDVVESSKEPFETSGLESGQ
eukprot:6967911-Lingulodinium_polyedra.AAC.1